MSVRLDAIKFNHNPNTVHDNAINIRRNATTFVDVPEWRAGVSVNAEDSLAAYAKKETAGQTLTIQTRFRWNSIEPAKVDIRALDATVEKEGPSGCLGLLIRIIRALFGNVLGAVKTRSVSFGGAGLGNWETFQLVGVKLSQVGVGIHLTSWRWQYRRRGGSWQDFDTSNHRIYVVLETPTAPWQQLPYAASNTQLPWTDVLDKACGWAIGAVDRDTAVARITQQVYDLGNSVIQYDCPGGGSTHYASPGFDCTAFLERIAGGPGLGQYVNCTDCATFVSTFANALGCDFWQSRMGWGFSLNPLLAIGSSTWQTACGWGGFSYHEVAWTGACDAVDTVCDACLQVDGDADPTSAPHTPLLPVNMVFGTPGSGDYRDKLSPAGSCDPQPGSRTRRAVF
ncbi:hypothetical protein WBP06_22305 [Novosphingobium sp. BL-8H]|uniref:hypothetical protein n=1 Tax=Novosphingobium sp. BL-8H TaxID=3127640 RepID=UPI00375743B2